MPMNVKYDPKKIESKWQKYWETKKTYQQYDRAKKFYALDMFPYPSGAGLHVGHPKGYIATDIVARKKQLEGYDVLHPMGWDAFGLPAERFAIKSKTHPKVSVRKNITNFKKQLAHLGFTYDWDREINTTDPEYYRWTQWIFLQLFKKGLVYESQEPINWCPTCQTGLANEDLEDGKCEVCGSEIEKKPLRQWVIRMTAYADRLLRDLDTEKLDWSESIKEQQRNWIGRSEGAVIKFQIINSKLQNNSQNSNVKNQDEFIEVFTTRVDTVFGCTYMVLAPEHGLISNCKFQISNSEEVRKYIESVKKKTEQERNDATKEKTGVKLEGIEAENPFTGETVPIFVADYVLGNYGTGAVMAVPAHDERDFAFAKKYELPIRQSIAPFFSDNEGVDAVRLDKPTVRRKTAFSIVKHWKGEKYLCLDWEKFGWHSGVIGGVEEGETTVEAAIREIIEETGYKHPKFIRFVGGEMHTNFYAAHKDVNRYAEGTGMLFYLEDGEREQPKEEEIINHKAVWISEGEMGSFLNLRNFQYMWNILETSKECFAEDGVLVDSGEFTGLKSEEAREKMAAWLEKKKLGKRQVNYKLRDWVFSRQRYWGEPIPLVKCRACGVKEWKPKYELSFYDQRTWKNILSGKKTIETRALNPDEPERYFGDVGVGEVLKFTNRKTHKSLAYRVKKVYRFSMLEDAVKDVDFERKVWADGKSRHSLDEWRKGYELCAPDYLARIEKYGLVGWEIEPVEMVKWIPVPEKDLPLRLPNVKSYEPSGTGESPLATIEKWVTTKCPTCGGAARRETNTMPQWAGSSWYYLRYIDPKNEKRLVDPKKEKEWMPVDLYVGGAEHATRHLLYARFWHKFLYDIGVVSTKEPFERLAHVGLIMASDGRKMSKRWGNVVNPDDMVRRFGADAVRLYEMFMGPFSQSVSWNTDGTVGMRRFLEKVWKLSFKMKGETGGFENKEVGILLHKTIKKVSEDIDEMRFNTAISSLMILVNEMEKSESVALTMYSTFLILLSPFAPHIAEELWSLQGNKKSIMFEKWPKANPKFLKEDTVEIVVQVNGKLRARLRVSADASREEIERMAREDDNVKKHLDKTTLQKIVFVPDRLVNFVLKHG